MDRREWLAVQLRAEVMRQRGLAAEDYLPWRQLQQSEQRPYIELAEVAIKELR